MFPLSKFLVTLLCYPSFLLTLTTYRLVIYSEIRLLSLTIEEIHKNKSIAVFMKKRYIGNHFIT